MRQHIGGHTLQRWNEDILAEIFGHLQSEIIDGPAANSRSRTLNSRRTSRHRNASTERHHSEYDLALIALARCARASRALHEPAINALWNTVHSISYLTGVLACTSSRRDRRDVNTNILVPIEEISPAAFERFQYYARRVRRLREISSLKQWHLGSAASASASEDSAGGDHREAFVLWLHQLRARFGDQPLLPNLAMLNWMLNARAPDPSEILPLVSPSLRTLQLITLVPTKSGYELTMLDPIKDALKVDPSTFLRQLSAAAPSLEYFSLTGCIPCAVLTHVGDLTQLQSLYISSFMDPFTGKCGFSVDHPAFRALAVLPNLQTLSITLTHDLVGSSTATQHTRSRPRSPAPVEFPNLRDLYVTSPLGIIPDVLARISSTAFHSFSITTSQEVHWADLHSALSTLVTRFPTTLRVVRVRVSLDGPLSEAHRTARLGELFAPLLEVRGLEVFFIDIGADANVALTASEALEFARAWPRLRDLALLCPCTPSGYPVDLLTTLAKTCPALKALHLKSLDLENVAACDLASLPVSDHGLQELYLGCDVPGKDSANMTPVAQVIDRIFPFANVRPLSGQKLALCQRRDWHEFRKCVRQIRSKREGKSSAPCTAV